MFSNFSSYWAIFFRWLAWSCFSMNGFAMRSPYYLSIINPVESGTLLCCSFFEVKGLFKACKCRKWFSLFLYLSSCISCSSSDLYFYFFSWATNHFSYSWSCPDKADWSPCFPFLNCSLIWFIFKFSSATSLDWNLLSFFSSLSFYTCW